MYYVTGFVGRKMLKSKYSKCKICKNAFGNCFENLITGVVDAHLVNVKSRGGLIHPNLHLFYLFNNVEKKFTHHIQEKTIDIYHQVIDEVIDDLKAKDTTIKFSCGEHSKEVLAYCIYFYLTMRMRHWTRIKNRENFKKSLHQKKISKLPST